MGDTITYSDKLIEKGNLIFSCKIMNGETIAICDNAKECNQICERHRFKQQDAKWINVKNALMISGH